MVDEENCRTIDELSQIDLLYGTPSDINEHLPTLTRYASLCDRVTEMGVRWCTSTWALLAGRPRTMVSYDVRECPETTKVAAEARRYGVRFSFVMADDLQVEIEETDLLFIDTLHTYYQLTSELNMHSGKVRRFIIVHDTVSFGEEDERPLWAPSPQQDLGRQGLMTAVLDFLESERGSCWEIGERFLNNNGLVVLRRKSMTE